METNAMIDSAHAVFTPRLQALGQAQIDRLYDASLTCLERTGVNMRNAEARSLLAQAGAQVEGQRVRIPARIILDAVAATPRSFTIFGRDGRPDMDVRFGNVYFGPGPTCTFFIDPQTGERRLSRRGDPAIVARVCDALPNIDYVMGLALIDDVPHHMAAAYEFAEMVANTGKPILAWAHSGQDLAAIYDIALAVAGDAAAFRERPFFGLFATCQSPLGHTDSEVANAFWAAERGIPLIYVGGGCAGVSSPVSGAGTLVISIAGILSGLAAIQLAHPGAPVCLGALPNAMDLRTAGPAYGSPETAIHGAAMCDFMRCLGLPFMGTAGATESKVLDMQAGIECAVQVLASGLSAATLVHDVGFLESAETGSLGCLVMNDEIISMTRRMMRPIPVDDEHLALDLIDRVGPGGEFVSQPETALGCRSQIWNPRLLDRSRWANWQLSGRKTMESRVNERIAKILAGHQSPALPADVAAQIESILNETTQELDDRPAATSAA